jgi:hypothetical protein
VAIGQPKVPVKRLSMRVVHEKVANKNLKILRINKGTRKKIDKVPALDLLIARVHVSLMRVLRRLMRMRFLIL